MPPYEQKRLTEIFFGSRFLCTCREDSNKNLGLSADAHVGEDSIERRAAVDPGLGGEPDYECVQSARI